MTMVLVPIWVYGYFFVLCLFPSLVFGVLFQFLISKPETRNYTVIIMTFLSLLIGVFIVCLLGVGIRHGLFYLLVATIVLSTFIVCFLRKYLLDRRKIYRRSGIEIIYTILFALFIAPIIMPVVLSLLYFSSASIYTYRNIFINCIYYLLPIELYF